MLRSTHLINTVPARTPRRRSTATARRKRLGSLRAHASASGSVVLLDSDFERLQLFLAAYTAFTDVDVQCLERLSAKLELAIVLGAEAMPSEVVRIGSHVWIQDMMSCNTHEHVLVFDTEAQAPLEALSILTPLGVALLGAREGDEIICPMAEGPRRLRIVKVFRPPETDGRDAATRRDESAVQILCATDLLPKTEHAIGRAALIADRLNAGLTLMHAFRTSGDTDSRVREQAEQALDELRSHVAKPGGRRATTPDVVARRGGAAAAIAATAQELDAALVVLGSHHRRVVRDSLVGTTLGHVLRTRVSPVLIVRRRPARPYRTVVFGLDLTPESLYALRVAEQLLLSAASARLIVHAYPPPYINSTAEFRKGWRRQATDRLTRHLSRAGIDSGRYDLMLEEGRPASALAAVARKRCADLVVVGTRGHQPLKRMLRAGVARKLANSIGCDLLVVPQRRSRKPTCMEAITHAR